MADRYLRATGNWNGAVWAATSGGAAGSAATPTASDDVFIAANFTVTLTADAVCANFYHTNGTLSLGSYTLDVSMPEAGGFNSTGSSARTINLGSGKLISNDYFILSGSNLTLISGTSLVELNYSYSWTGMFDTLSKTFNDVRINMGINGSSGSAVNITGSPTFRSLIIQSKNSAAHTVKFTDYYVRVTKLVMIGSSIANRMKIRGDSSNETEFWIQDGGSVYGQFLDISDDADGISMATNEEGGGNHWGGPSYAGANSIATDSDWLLQDPPKISTLVDPLTTAPGSNTNWTVHPVAESFATLFGVAPVVAALHEGAYVIGLTPDETSFGGMMSTDTYDFTNSTFIMEVLRADGGSSGGITIVLDASESTELQRLEWVNDFSPVSGSPDDIITYSLRGVTYSVSNTLTYTSNPRWVKIRMDDDTLYTSISFDGLTFTTEKSLALPDDVIYLLKSTRVSLVNTYTAAIGSINPELAPANNANFLQFF